jgi:type I restriction enzyme, R subunit
VLYNVHHLSSNKVDPVARVAISTIQRVYSILRGDLALDPEADVAVDPEAGLTSVRRL